MSYLDTSSGQIAAHASESERSTFIKRTYLHVGGGLATLAILEFLLIISGFGQSYLEMITTIKWYPILALVVFMAVSYVASGWAHSGISREKQYLGLGVYIAFLALFFLPNIYIAQKHSPDVLLHATVVTAALVAGITYTAFTTKINFSFLGKFLTIGMFIAIGVGISGIIFGFSLGTFFSAAVVLLFAGFVLYDTSNIIHEYGTDQYVGASLALFSSIAFLFINLVSLFLGFGGSDD
ncbi:MAG: US12 family protein [Cocleimonas sp.]|nr:US12 family protein [Cocleimonas sp.]